MYRSLCASLSCTCLLLLASAAHSQSGELTFREAVQRTLRQHPDLAAFAYELNAQEGRVQSAGARAPLEVGVLVENAFGTGARSGFDVAETTVSIGFVLEGNVLERRRASVIAGRDVLETELKLKRADVAAETARRYITVLEGQRHLDELRGARQLSEQTLVAVQARVRAAKVPQAEEARAQASLAKAQLEEEHAEHELLTARRRLAAQWGDMDATFKQASGDLLTLMPLPDYESVRQELDRNPDFERFVTEQRLHEAELRVAESRRRPPWQVTAGVRRFEDSDDHAFVVGLTVPLASRDYARGEITAARAQIESVDAKRNAARVKLDAELFAMYQELSHSYKEVELLRDSVLPKMERAVDETRYAYERGRYGYVEWAAAQRELIELRHSLLEAYADVHLYRIEIERLTGTSLLERDLP
jgi:outer membrane protein, heavy metal efflux system